jgi:2-polyprenyl-3-methyl-5-hydroxy-6-metoxy-1,4-benzoquinol methylase
MEPAEGPSGSREQVRAIHNNAAQSADPAVQSVRPAGTSRRQLARMLSDVVKKLRPTPQSVVLELGCGTGVLAVPLAAGVQRYVAVDFAENALDVLRGRLHEHGLDGSTTALCRDIASNGARLELGGGEFDRVLMYSVLQYARSADDAKAFLSLAVSALRPGGRALVGNVPLAELAGELSEARHGRAPTRIVAFARWVATPSRMGHTRRWKLRALLYLLGDKPARSRRAVDRPGTPSLPPGVCVEITRAHLTEWLGDLPVPCSVDWVAPAPGIPLALDRVDLVVTRLAPQDRESEERGVTRATPWPVPGVIGSRVHRDGR